MTETKVNDSSRTPDRMYTRYGTYGVTVTALVSVWISQYLNLCSDEKVFDDVIMIVNKSTGVSALWAKEIFNER